MAAPEDALLFKNYDSLNVELGTANVALSSYHEKMRHNRARRGYYSDIVRCVRQLQSHDDSATSVPRNIEAVPR